MQDLNDIAYFAAVVENKGFSAAARALALRLWSPLLSTHPGGEPVEKPMLADTWTLVAQAPAEILDVVRERRQHEGADLDRDLPLEVLAIQLGGYALDACGEEDDLGPGRGPTAHDTCLWLRKIAGLADGSRDLPPALKSALSNLFWRLVDTTRLEVTARAPIAVTRFNREGSTIEVSGGFGTAQLPIRSLVPVGDSFEFAENGRFHFHVEIGHRLTGPIVRYRGWLKPLERL